MFKTITVSLLMLSILAPMAYYIFGAKTKVRFKRTIITNGFSFFSFLITATILMYSGNAFAANGEALSDAVIQTAYISAALVTGIACIGAGIAVAASASAALGAISENERILGKALIFVALAEGIALYGLLVSFTILGQVM